MDSLALERFAAIERVANLGAVEVNLATKEVLWSEGAQRLLDLPKMTGSIPRDQSVPMFLSRVHPDDREAARRVLNQTFEQVGMAEPIDFRVILPDGRMRWIHRESLHRASSETQSAHVVAILQDITERKEIEITLGKSLAEAARISHVLRVHAVFNELLLRVHDEQALIDGLCDEIVEVGGYPLAWVGRVEHDPDKHVVPISFAAKREALKDYVSGADVSWAESERGQGPSGQAIRTKATVVTRNLLTAPGFRPWSSAARQHGLKSSLVYPVVVDGEPIYALMVYSEIVAAFDEEELELLNRLGANLTYGIESLRAVAARKAAEAEAQAALSALRASETKFRALIEQATDMVAVIDYEGRLVYSSPSAADIAITDDGHTSVTEAAHPDDREAVQQAIASLSAEHGTASGRTRMRHNDGTWHHIAWSARNAGDVPGVEGIIVNARDITSELSRDEQLQQARKLEAIGQLAGGIAHDFNNILAAILGFADFLVQDLPEQSAERGFAERIVSAALRARDLVRQILTFARKSAVERQPTDLVTVAREAFDLLKGTLPPSTELRFEATPSDLVADVNPSQVSQIVLNLCVNASDALEGQAGRVSVRVAKVEAADVDAALFLSGRMHADDGVVVFGNLAPGRVYACISVLDSGHGMAADVLSRVFDPFFTTKGRGRGSGLGLSVVHGIVAEYGGACFIESRLGLGTVVRVYIPLMDDGAAAAADPKQAFSLAGTERVLVIDDEAVLTEMLKIGLSRFGYAVTVSNDPLQALKLVERDPMAFDAAILDHIMPRLTGLELVRQLKAVRPDLPVLLCTGLGDGATEETAEAAGADSFLIKPVLIEELTKALRDLLAEDRASPAVGAA